MLAINLAVFCSRNCILAIIFGILQYMKGENSVALAKDFNVSIFKRVCFSAEADGEKKKET